MRSTADRIRQAVSFEIIGILIVTPLFAWTFDHPIPSYGRRWVMRPEKAAYRGGC